ncbi:MAG: hypothetical protein MPW15_13880 [Candidatus Manganitrophus sp.]|nr:hypothetical protein [Candidatus Manganitrophus sp.]
MTTSAFSVERVCFPLEVVTVRTVYFFEEIRKIVRDKIDDVQFHRFLLGDGDRFANRFFGPLGVPASPLRQRSDISGGIIRDLLLHLLIHLSSHRDRVGRADIGAGGHRREMRREGDEDPRRSRPPAAGGDINDDRDLRSDHRLDDIPHRGIEPAGGIELDDQRLGAGLLGLRDRRREEFGRHRIDDPVIGDHMNRLRLGQNEVERREKKRKKTKNSQDKDLTKNTHGINLSPLPEGSQERRNSRV